MKIKIREHHQTFNQQQGTSQQVLSCFSCWALYSSRYALPARKSADFFQISHCGSCLPCQILSSQINQIGKKNITQLMSEYLLPFYSIITRNYTQAGNVSHLLHKYWHNSDTLKAIINIINVIKVFILELTVQKTC